MSFETLQPQTNPMNVLGMGEFQGTESLKAYVSDRSTRRKEYATKDSRLFYDAWFLKHVNEPRPRDLHQEQKRSREEFWGKLSGLFSRPDKLTHNELVSIDRAWQASREDLFKNLSVAKLILLARYLVSSRVANRLFELSNQPFDPEDEEPIDISSVACFLKFCSQRSFSDKPIITATPSGCIQVDRRETGKSFSIRFLHDGTVWFACTESAARIYGEAPLEELLSKKSHFSIPDWV